MSDYLLDRPLFNVPADLDGDPARYVYLHIAEDGTALYVGCTRTPYLRTKAHATGSDWFEDVCDIVWYPTNDPHRVETDIIKALQPPNNIKHTMRDPMHRRHLEVQAKIAARTSASLAAKAMTA
jgi:predicted GIY-YIG superfamily endonuclease